MFRFKVVVLLYIAHFLKNEVTGRERERKNLRERKVFASRTGEIKKKFTRSVDRKQRYFSRRPYCTYF